MGKEQKQRVKAIKDLGFTEDQAVNALAISKNDQNQAIDYLL